MLLAEQTYDRIHMVDAQLFNMGNRSGGLSAAWLDDRLTVWPAATMPLTYTLPLLICAGGGHCAVHDIEEAAGMHAPVVHAPGQDSPQLAQAV